MKVIYIQQLKLYPTIDKTNCTLKPRLSTFYETRTVPDRQNS